MINKTNKICVDMSLSCFIDADKLMMHNILTDDVKPYSQINDDEDGWFPYEYLDIIKNSSDVLYDFVEIMEKTD